jgi:carbamoylphosphate synthase small subunit
LADNDLRLTKIIRNLYEMSGKQETDMTAEDFDDLATKIASIASAYASVASTMREREINKLRIFGVDTLRLVTLIRINGPVQSAQRALLTAKKSTGSSTAYKVAEDPEKLRIASDAAKANKTAADRKKKKSE